MLGMEPKNQVIWTTCFKVLAKYFSIYFDIFYGNLVYHQLDQKRSLFSLMICIEIFLAFGRNWIERNLLKKMILSENVIFQGLRLSLGHFGQQALKWCTNISTTSFHCGLIGI